MVNFIFAEFGRPADLVLTQKNLQEYFPDATFQVYTDHAVYIKGNLGDTIVVKPPWRAIEEHYGNRCNDYFKVKGLLDSKKEYNVALDGDMKCVSDTYKTIVLLMHNFGVCLPINPRNMVRIDQQLGRDVDTQVDKTEGAAQAVNMSPIAFHRRHKKGRSMLATYCLEMLETPRRGPLVMWRAIYKTGFMPCLLPAQWCVCREHVGIGNEIMLHIGHREVTDHYGR